MANNKAKVKTTKAKKNGRLVKIDFSSEYQAPIPVVEDYLDYINYGDTNSFPDHLLKLKSTSGIHSAILNRKIDMVVGEGFDDDDLSPETLKWMEAPNEYEDLDSIFEKCAQDLETHGQFYLQVLWNTRLDKPTQIYYMPANRMRVGEPNEFGFSEEFIYWDDLSEPMSTNTTFNSTITYPKFSTTDRKDEPQILHVKRHSNTNQYYGSPNYIASVQDIQTYSEISNFMNSLLNKSFAPSHMIFFTGEPASDELVDNIVASFKSSKTGTDNVGDIIFGFLEDGMVAPSITPIASDDLDKKFEALIKQLINNIALGHGIPRQLIGIETAGSLGNSKEMLEASQLFYSSYVMKEQKLALKPFNKIMELNGFDELTILNTSPTIMLYELSDLLQILTQDELRLHLGYTELENVEIVTEETPVVEEEIIEPIVEKINDTEDE